MTSLVSILGDYRFHVLIDSGSTHNFIKPTIVEHLQLPESGTPCFRVFIEMGTSCFVLNVALLSRLFYKAINSPLTSSFFPLKDQT